MPSLLDGGRRSGDGDDSDRDAVSASDVVVVGAGAIGAWTALLDPRVFQRVHRSTIVNLNQVRQVKPHTNGECFLVLESGAQVKVSRSYRDVVARFVH